MNRDTAYQCLMADDADPTYGQDTYEGDGGEDEGEIQRVLLMVLPFPISAVSKHDAPLPPNFWGP
jgi:hypothetical protein